MNASSLPAICVILGYFVHDAIASIPTWSTYPADVIHHLLAFAILGSGVRDPTLLRAAPHLGLVEISTVFLNLAWLCRELRSVESVKRPAGAVYRASTLAFAGSFTLLRVLWWAYLLHRMRHDPEGRYGRFGRIPKAGLYAAYILQLYWFRRILSLVTKSDGHL